MAGQKPGFSCPGAIALNVVATRKYILELS